MQPVSEQYLQDMAAPVRGPSYIKIEYGLIDPQGQPASTISASNGMWYSRPNDIDLGFTIQRKYSRMLDNYTPLDGKFTPVPGAADYQGLVSETITDGFGAGVVLVLDIDFGSELIRLPGLSFTFDRFSGNHPTGMQSTVYLGSTVVESFQEPIDGVDWLLERVIPNTGTCDRILITFSGSKFPYRDVSIENIVFGLSYSLTAVDIESANVKRKVDPIGQSLPSEDSSFTFFDMKGEFKEENKQGKFSFIESQQPVMISFGQELSNGEIEWLRPIKHLATGEASGYSDLQQAKVTIKASSLLSHMTSVYREGKYSSTPKTLYALATEVIESYGLAPMEDGRNQWEFDQVQMSKFTTTQPVSAMAYNQALQLLAGAALCVLYTDWEGRVRIEPRNFVRDSDFIYDYAKLYSPPDRHTWPVLRDVYVDYRSLRLETSSELARLDVSESSDTEYVIQYVASSGHTYTTTGSVTVVSVTFYLENATIVARGAGEVVVSGQAVSQTTSVYSKNYAVAGEDDVLHPQFIDTPSHAEQYADFIASFLQMQNEYRIADRGNPEIDPLDTILAQTGFTDSADVVVTSTNITYSGSISGDTTYYLKGV